MRPVVLYTVVMPAELLITPLVRTRVIFLACVYPVVSRKVATRREPFQAHHAHVSPLPGTRSVSLAYMCRPGRRAYGLRPGGTPTANRVTRGT